MTILTSAQHLGESVANVVLFEQLEAKIGRLLTADIERTVHCGQSVATQAGLFHFSKGGRRTRGKLAVYASLALGLSEHDALCLAAVAELLHNASLIHDDLQDRDKLRHEWPTVWFKYGPSAAICTGDLLLSAAYAALSGVSNVSVIPALLSLVHDRTSQAVHGQCADLDSLKNRVMHLNVYERIVRAKSGALFSLPLELALVACGQSRWTALARHATEAFSLAYQAADDLIDVCADAQKGNLNIVSVLEAVVGVADAESHACQYGLKHLDMADIAATNLPCQSGHFLLQLSNEMRVFFDNRSGS